MSVTDITELARDAGIECDRARKTGDAVLLFDEDTFCDDVGVQEINNVPLLNTFQQNMTAYRFDRGDIFVVVPLANELLEGLGEQKALEFVKDAVDARFFELLDAT